MEEKSVLILGGTGFIGSFIVDELCRKGYKVTILSRNKKNYKSLNKKTITIDELESIPPQNTIINLATYYGRDGENIEKLIETNILLAVRVFEKTKAWKSELIVNTDTYYSRITESHGFENYILSKKQLKEWLKVRYSNKIKVANMQLEHVFGPNDNKDKFCTQIINSCISNAKRIDLSPCTQKRDFIYIDDIVSAYLTIIEKRASLTKGFNQFEIGTGKINSLRDFAEACKKISNSKVELNYGALQMHKNELMISRANNIDMKKLGWSSIYSMEDGLKKIISENEDININNS